MSNRFKNAIAAQRGACNPRPIASALVEAIGECYTEGVAPPEDPAVYLIFHQLQWLLTGTNLDVSRERWRLSLDACEAASGETL